MMRFPFGPMVSLISLVTVGFAHSDVTPFLMGVLIVVTAIWAVGELKT